MIHIMHLQIAVYGNRGRYVKQNQSFTTECENDLGFNEKDDFPLVLGKSSFGFNTHTFRQQ